MKIKNAILSVYDKSHLDTFAKKLVSYGITLYSTGGSKAFLSQKNIPVHEISNLTQFPEILEGRVKTLHPFIHGGILAKRSKQKHLKTIQKHQIPLIDLVVVNLYPFKEISKKKETSLEEAIENIDIGGPTLIRSAAKNYLDVAVVCDINDYEEIIKQIEKKGEPSLELKKKLAVKAFSHTACYDRAIEHYLKKNLLNEDSLCLNFSKGKPLRYGENPHQKAFLYFDTEQSLIGNLKQLHGKKMSYNNYIDVESALKIILDLKNEYSHLMTIIKHSNPCGLATGHSSLEALEKAWEGDPVSSFGSIIASVSPIDKATALFLANQFIEIIIAPDFSQEALSLLKKKKNLRIFKIPKNQTINSTHYRLLEGALLKQEKNKEVFKTFKCVTKETINFNEKKLFQFTYQIAKYLKSNAIAIGLEYKKDQYMLIGAGTGQPNRLDSVKSLALPKAIETIKRLYPKEKTQKILANCVLASDAFFPFADNILSAQRQGIKKIVQPGGSIRDQEVIDACNQAKIAMIFTKTRHFTH